MKPFHSPIAFACLLAVLGCDRKTGVQKAAEAADRAMENGGVPSATIRIAAAAGPVAWLGCEVVGAPCEPVGLVPPGASTHTWEPRPSDLAKLGGSDMWLRTGLAFEEAWTPRFRSAFPKLPMLDLRGSLDLENADHHHGARHGEEMDPHVWASPRAMATLAETLAVRVVAARPDLRERVSANLPRLRMRLRSIDSATRELLAPWSGRTFLINHPGLGYLARDYGIVQRSLESDGRELSPVDLFEIRRVARAQGVKAVFVQREASDRAARSIAEEIGVPLVDLDLLSPPWDSAFLGAVRALAQNL